MLSDLAQKLEPVFAHLHNEYAKLSVGRARPELVEGVMVSVYWSPMPVKNVATVSIMDSQTLAINPFDKWSLQDIAAGISAANLGLNPQDNGEGIIINIPQVTEERRIELVKVAKGMAEDARVSVRNIRSDYHKKIQHAKQENEASEDEARDLENDLQKVIDDANKKIDEQHTAKEADIMKV